MCDVIGIFILLYSLYTVYTIHDIFDEVVYGRKNMCIDMFKTYVKIVMMVIIIFVYE